MPLPEGTRFRFKTGTDGKKQRLAFDRAGKVIEAVSYDAKGQKTGATHTPAEFKADRKAGTRKAMRFAR